MRPKTVQKILIALIVAAIGLVATLVAMECLAPWWSPRPPNP
jgi:hypothetical protein